MAKLDVNYHEVEYHIDGYNEYGGFTSKTFDALKDALEYWGNDKDWLNASLVAEHFYCNRREYETIREVQVLPIHKLFRY